MRTYGSCWCGYAAGRSGVGCQRSELLADAPARLPILISRLAHISRLNTTAMPSRILRMRSLITLSLCTVLASCATAGRSDSGAPADGRALLARMHERYERRWFNTLTFVQRTTQRRPDGTSQVSTWYEAVRGSRLRIDVGDPTAGNGALYTPDSLYVVRAGKIVRAMAEGNPFLPLIM